MRASMYLSVIRAEEKTQVRDARQSSHFRAELEQNRIDIPARHDEFAGDDEVSERR